MWTESRIGSNFEQIIFSLIKIDKMSRSSIRMACITLLHRMSEKKRVDNEAMSSSSPLTVYFSLHDLEEKNRRHLLCCEEDFFFVTFHEIVFSFRHRVDVKNPFLLSQRSQRRPSTLLLDSRSLVCWFYFSIMRETHSLHTAHADGCLYRPLYRIIDVPKKMRSFVCASASEPTKGETCTAPVMNKWKLNIEKFINKKGPRLDSISYTLFFAYMPLICILLPRHGAACDFHADPSRSKPTNQIDYVIVSFFDLFFAAEM